MAVHPGCGAGSHRPARPTCGATSHAVIPSTAIAGTPPAPPCRAHRSAAPVSAPPVPPLRDFRSVPPVRDDHTTQYRNRGVLAAMVHVPPLREYTPHFHQRTFGLPHHCDMTTACLHYGVLTPRLAHACSSLAFVARRLSSLLSFPPLILLCLAKLVDRGHTPGLRLSLLRLHVDWGHMFLLFAPLHATPHSFDLFTCLFLADSMMACAHLKRRLFTHCLIFCRSFHTVVFLVPHT